MESRKVSQILKKLNQAGSQLQTLTKNVSFMSTPALIDVSDVKLSCFSASSELGATLEELEALCGKCPDMDPLDSQHLKKKINHSYSLLSELTTQIMSVWPPLLQVWFGKIAQIKEVFAEVNEVLSGLKDVPRGPAAVPPAEQSGSGKSDGARPETGGLSETKKKIAPREPDQPEVLRAGPPGPIVPIIHQAFGKSKGEEERLKALLDETGEMLTKLNARIVGLEANLQKAKDRCGELQSERDRLEGEKKVVLQESEEKSAAINVLESDKKRLEEAKQRLEAEKKSVEEERACLKDERPGLAKALEDRSGDLAVLRREKESLAEELERNCGAKDQALARAKEAGEDAARAVAETEKIRARCADLENEVNQIRSERDKKAGPVEDLKKKIKETEDLLNEKAAAQAICEEELRREKEMCAKFQSHSQCLEKIFLSLERKIENLASPSA